jgi:hypothetical protein
MTRFTWTGLLLAGAVGGCTSNFVAPSKDSGPAAANARPSLPPPVTAGQITPENAPASAQLLRAEMDRDMRQAQDATDSKK